MTFKIGKIGLTECLSRGSEPSKYAYFKVHYASHFSNLSRRMLIRVMLINEKACIPKTHFQTRFLPFCHSSSLGREAPELILGREVPDPISF